MPVFGKVSYNMTSQTEDKICKNTPWINNSYSTKHLCVLFYTEQLANTCALEHVLQPHMLMIK